MDLLLTISGEELLESGELLWDDGVEERSASSTYLGFWIDFFRRLFVGVRDSSSNSTSLGGAFFFLGVGVVVVKGSLSCPVIFAPDSSYHHLYTNSSYKHHILA